MSEDNITFEDLDLLTDDKIESLTKDEKSMSVLYKRYGQTGQSLEEFKNGVRSTLKLVRAWQIVKEQEQ